MSGECQICHEHCLDCKCGKQDLPSDYKNVLISEEGKKAFLKALNERFKFTKEGEMIPKTENAYDPIILSEYMERYMSEEVNHPSHYRGKTFEAIDIIEDYDLNFNLGNAIKYILRCDKKGSRNKDLEKAVWYLQREINSNG
jgi:Protein of unknwon function (DUF3310)